MAKEVKRQDGNAVEWTVVPDHLHVTIVSPEQTLFEGEVDSLTVPGEKGRFEVLKGHAPIISSLAAGVVACKGAEAFELEVRGGFIEVAHNAVSVCVEV
ncbi:MAG: F0F1 ATP synthase subunit epsilon [Alloprevotella sp.]|nr:F0F1 ATP synthase subunit epsilon [Alloprevotella sp.]